MSRKKTGLLVLATSVNIETRTKSLYQFTESFNSQTIFKHPKKLRKWT